MKLVIGLGNPGNTYINSRHNIGFLAVGALAKSFNETFKRNIGTYSLSAKCKINNEDILLAKPVTFMNLSGKSAIALIRKYKIAFDNLLVVCDDLDLEFGRLRLKGSGSSGGHNGLQSIISSLHTNNFCRLRIGIGRPGKNRDAADYVLSNFAKEEKLILADVIECALSCIEVWAKEGKVKAMNMFNKNIKYESKRVKK